MKTDSLGRRIRTKRQPLGNHIQLQERDLAIFEFLHRHGGRLPTSFIHDATKHIARDKQRLSHRLKDLYHEARLLDRDWKQEETRDPEYNELVHELNDNSIELLKERGLYSPYTPSMRGAYKHQVMLSCISASFELNTQGTDLTYIPQHHLLNRAGRDHQMTIAGDYVTPDEVFGLQIDGKDLFLFLEIDRGTEATSSQNFNRKSWTRSIKQYRQVIGHGHYKDHFKVNHGALLLIITVSKAKQEGILKVIQEEYPQGCNYILVTHMPEFGRAFHPPKQIDLLKRKWERCGHPPFQFMK